MSLINAEYFSALREQVENISDCRDLQRVADEALQPVYDLQAKIIEEQAKLAPILALLEPPSLDTIVTWASDLITLFIGPYVEPYFKYNAQLVLLTAEVAQLIAAIEEKKSSITNCSISLPTPPALPPIP